MTQPSSSDNKGKSKNIPIVDRILERTASIPEEELSMFPADFTENLDHYLYGRPKKSKRGVLA